MSSRLRKCDATRQHTMTATRMTMFEPLAAARPAVGSSRSLCWGEPHPKGAGRIITQSQAWGARWNLARRVRALGLVWATRSRSRRRRSVSVARARVRYSILRQYFRGGRDLPLTARTSRAGSLRRGREKLSGGRRGRARAPGPGAPRALLRRRRPGCIRRAGLHGGQRAASGHG